MGTFFVLVEADYGQIVDEFNETNNINSSVQIEIREELVDTEGPVISFSPPAESFPEDFSIDFTVSDNSGFVDQVLFYKKGALQSADPTPIELFSGNNQYSADIFAVILTTRGLRYGLQQLMRFLIPLQQQGKLLCGQ